MLQVTLLRGFLGTSHQPNIPNFQLANQGLRSILGKSCHQQSLLSVLGRKEGIQIVHTASALTRILVWYQHHCQTYGTFST